MKARPTQGASNDGTRSVADYVARAQGYKSIASRIPVEELERARDEFAEMGEVAGIGVKVAENAE